jgi:hypothetical protein
VEVTLTEPRFRLNSTSRGNKFIGRATSSGVVFTLDYYGWYYYSYYGPTAYPNVAERLADNTILVIEGSVAAAGTSSRVTGTFSSGAMTRWDARFPNFALSMGGCSTSLQLTLTQK